MLKVIRREKKEEERKMKWEKLKKCSNISEFEKL